MNTEFLFEHYNVNEQLTIMQDIVIDTNRAVSLNCSEVYFI